MSWILVATALTAATAAESRDFRSHLDQARFFLRKEWYSDALAELELAVASDDGKLDPEAWFLLSKVRYELGDLPGARFAADRALVNSRDQEQARQAQELLSFFDQKFGTLKIEAPLGGSASRRVDLALESTLFDPDLKLWINKVLVTLEDPVALPHEIGLPVARYRVFGAEIDVVAGTTVSVTPPDSGARRKALPPPAPTGGGGPRPAPAALDAPVLGPVELEVGLGVSQTVGSRVANLLPAPATDLGVGTTFGPLSGALTASWTPQPYQTREQTVVTEVAVFGFGARLGAELPVAPIVLRPSATWRVTSMPGVEVGCAQVASAWTCDRAVATDDEELFVYTAALAHAVGVELAAVFRTAPWAFGLKTAGEWLVGALPRDGSAIGADGEYGFTLDGPRGLSGGGWRVLGVVQIRPTTGG